MPQTPPRAARAFLSLRLCALALIPACAAPAAFAQTRITHSIRLIVPYVPGGGTDILSRLLGPAIGDEFGQQVVVDNKPGGGSTIGTGQVAKAAPDGYTLGMIDAAFVTNPSLMKQLPYDSRRKAWPSSWRTRNRNRGSSRSARPGWAPACTWPPSSSAPPPVCR
jgi:tripartite-type tricarboxylate transporter receptor subunit TctC